MRLTILALAGFCAAPALAACAGYPVERSLPAGLTYSCSSGPAMVVYDGQGYLPGSSARTPDATASGQAPTQAPRSTAQLWYGGRRYRLMADYAEVGLRYRSVEAVSETHALVWAADGESAWIGEAPIARGGAERRLAECTRDRSVAPGGWNAGHGQSGAATPPAAERPQS